MIVRFPRLMDHSINTVVLFSVISILSLWLSSAWAQENDTSNEAYVDALIDPEKAEDAYEDYESELRDAKNLYHDIELKYLYDRPTGSDQADRYAGVKYSTATSTINFGELFVDILALDESRKSNQRIVGTNFNTEDEDGIGRWLIRQLQFPVTENIYADNYVGMHRSGFRPRFGNNFVSRRFNSLSPEIKGVTSKLHRGYGSVALSAGKIGRNRGPLFPGFVDQKIDLIRLQARQAFDHHLFTGDIWQTTDRDPPEVTEKEIEGFRLTMDSLLPKNWRSSASAVSSDKRQAYLFTAEQRKRKFRQDMGAYFYEPDIVWIDRILSNDNQGLFYRFSNKKRIVDYGASAEFRQDGIEEIENEKDTTLLTANAGYRINRNNRISGFFSFRDVDAVNNQKSFEEYFVRTFLNYRHDNNTTSTIGATAREKKFETGSVDTSGESLYYSQTRQLNNDAIFDFSLETRRELQEGHSIKSHFAQIGWQREYNSGQSFSAQLGYHISDSSRFRDNDSWYGNISHFWPLSDRLSLSTRAGYNRTIYQIDEELNEPDRLVTDFGFEDDGLVDDETQSWSILLSLKYTTGGFGQSKILAPNPTKIGSGRVKGSVFIDENQDGIRQAFEKGLAGVEVFLDSIYPAQTDGDGNFIFPTVGLGKHHVFTDESQLPLPWMLSREEIEPANVELRTTTLVNIPVVNLPE